MTDDWYVAVVEAASNAVHEVCQALQGWDVELAEARRWRAEGVPLREMLNRGVALGSRERRVAADEAIAAYRNAVMRLRAAVVRKLVDEEGMTLTAAAKSLKVSRQMASRLYGSAPVEVRGSP